MRNPAILLISVIVLMAPIIAWGQISFPAGCDSAEYIAITPDGEFAYVSCWTGDINKIQLSDYSIVRTMNNGGYGSLSLAITNDGQFLYSSNAVNGYYTRKYGLPDDTLITDIPGGTDPAALAISSNDSLIYIINHWSGFMQIVTVTDNMEIARVSGIGNGALGIALSPDNLFAYVTVRSVGPNPDAGLLKISSASNEIVASNPSLKGDELVVIADGSEVWVGGVWDNYIYIVNAESMAILDSISVLSYSPGRAELAITPDGKYVFYANIGSDSLVCISVFDRQIVSTVATGDGPTDMAISKNGQKLYVTNQYDGSITEYMISRLTHPEAVWCEGFEDYLLPDGWTQNWTGSGNIPGIIVDSNEAKSGNKSLRIFGALGSCWGGVATRPLTTNFPVSFDCWVRNGSEGLSGCHPYRSALSFRPGPDWTDIPEVSAFYFLENGDLDVRIDGGSSIIPGLALNEWHHIRMELSKHGDSYLYTRLFVNDIQKGEFIRKWEHWMDTLPYFSIQSDEGSSWFDDICIWSGDSIDFDALYIPNSSTCLSVNGNFRIPVKINCNTPTVAMNIPLKWDDPHMILDSVSYIGTAVENWGIKENPIDGVNRNVVLGLATYGEDYIQTGWDTTVAYLYFSLQKEAGMPCYLDVAFDTTFSDIESKRLLFGDTSYPTIGFVPVVNFAAAKVGTYIPGDYSDNGAVNILDVSTLIQYLYKGLSPLRCIDAADVNGDCAVNILDISYLINYLYKHGPAPVCGCAEAGYPSAGCCGGTVAAEKVAHNADITANYVGGKTIISINSPVDIFGLEMVLKASDGTMINISNKINEMQVYSSQSGNEIKLGMLDIQGNGKISSGNSTVLEFDGMVDIVEALGADISANEVDFSITNAAEKAEALPTKFELAQNHPNPFNPITEISFSLPKTCEVSLEIYNVSGQKVVTLANGTLEAGQHSIVWDSRGSNGVSVASGIYFYRLKAGDFVDTKKMMLLK